MQARNVQSLIPARRATEGAGVQIKRSLGQSPDTRLDPFLLLDAFSSDRPEDYLAGFPTHPHRGFETVTYMLEGHMLHEDHLGNRGHLKDGGAQWMTAGRGILHSEMPQQTEGQLRGFQLWINLPGAAKMQAPGYSDVQAEQLPRRDLPRGGEAILIAGRTRLDNEPATGYFNGLDQRLFDTDPIFVDLHFADGESVETSLPPGHNAFVYVYQGEVVIGDRTIGADRAAVLEQGDRVHLAAYQAPACALLVAARPLGEPVVQYGPFVMNTAAEIEQALRDYRDGRLAPHNPTNRSITP